MYDDDDRGVPSNEEWRNDPARRRAAADHHERQSAALREALPHLTAAYEALRGLPYGGAHDPRGAMIGRVFHHVVVAWDDAKKISTEPSSDTYVGNSAAFGVGWPDH